ncbi:hypothetical protein OR621_21610, partial [Aeromonas caviae]
HIGVRLITTRSAFKLALRLAVILRSMPTTGALLARVGRVYRQHLTASPCLLIFELAAQLKPALI